MYPIFEENRKILGIAKVSELTVYKYSLNVQYI